MSYEYGQYSDGFDLDLPEPLALRFNDLLKRNGETIRVVWQTLTGYDNYGSPVKTETSYDEPGLVKTSPNERWFPIGYVRQNHVEVLMRRWAVLDKDRCELEIGFSRYRLTGYMKTKAYLMVLAEMEVPQ